MTIDARAYVWCNLGPLSEEGSSIAEDHAQGTGVIMYKGTINLEGIHRPAQGARVQLAYSDGQGWIARLPLRLRVLSCFSNPLTKKTSVSVGCDFAYYENRKEPVTLDTRDENTNISEAEWRAATPAISGSWLVGMILCILKIRYDGTIPLTNYYTRQDFDMSAGYVEELSKLCASEGYVCRINSLGKAEFIKKDPAIGTGALLTEADLIDFNPVNSGELPGDAVYSKYESLKLKAPKDDDEEDTEEERQKRNWEREESFGMLQTYQHNWTVYESVPTAEYEEFKNAAGQHLYEITDNSTVVYNDKIIKEPGGPWLIQRYEIKAFEKSSEHDYIPYSITTTTYDDKDRAIKRVTITNTVWGEERSETWFTYRALPGESSSSGGGSGSGLNDWNTFVCVYEEQEEEGGSSEPLVPLQPNFRSAQKEDDNGEIIQERTLEWKRLAPLKMQAGVKTLSFEGLRASSGGTYQSLYRETNYEKNKASGITKTTTRVLVPFIETPDGSETISTIRDQIQPWLADSPGGQVGLTDLSDMAASLVEYGSETRIRTEREFGIQRRPKAAERTAEANKKTPEVEQEERMAWAIGSSASQTAIELTPPYAPDDRIVGGNGSYAVIPSDAATKVLAYARTENRYLLGHRNGNGIQVLPEVLPAKPISVFYIRLNGCTAAFLVNGRTWNIDPSGCTMTADALFWGAVDGAVADAWFPMPPGATSLPAPVAIATNANPRPANAINIPSGFDFGNPNLQTLFSSLPTDSAPVFAKTVTPGRLVKPYNETIALAAGGGSGAIVNPQFWIAQPAGEYLAGSGSGVIATAVAGPSTSLGARWTSGTTFSAAAGTAGPGHGGGEKWSSGSVFTAGAGSDGLVRAPGARWTSATVFTAGSADDGLELAPGARWTSGSTFTAGAGSDDLEQAPGAAWSSGSVFTAGAGDDGIELAPGASWSSGSVFTAGAGNSGLVQGSGASWTSGSVFYAGAGAVGSGAGAGATWTSGSAFTAGAGSVFDPDFGDPDFDKVSLLLHMDGANNSTAFVDSSSSNRTITVVGDAKVSTAQSKFGGASAAFDGSGDLLTATVTGGLGSGAFTVEFFMWRNTNTQMIPVFNSRVDGSAQDGIDIFSDGRVSTTNVWIFQDAAVSETTLPVGAWCHIAITRTAAGVMRRWINGVQVGADSTISSNFTGSSVQIGGSSGPNSGSMNGFIDEFRLTVGLARYTSAFTPPTKPFSNFKAASGATWTSGSVFTAGAGSIDTVALYLPFAGNFNDQSSAALTPTVFGNAYAANQQGVFDGVGDYVTFPEAALVISGDFTIELWAYFADLSDRVIMSGTSSPDTNVQLFRMNGGNLSVYMNNGGQIINAASGIVVNTWYHLALSRSGNSTRLFVNGSQIGSTFSGWTAGFSCNVIAQQFFNGNIYTLGQGNFSGRLRELRVLRQALYTANFTPPASAPGASWTSNSVFNAQGSTNTDPYFSNVSLLLHMDGANGSTTFTDSSSNNVAITRVGSGTISTAQAKFSQSYLNGTRLVIPASSLFSFDGDFTVECWFYQVDRFGYDTLLELGAYDNGIMLRNGYSNPGIWVNGYQFAHSFSTLNQFIHIAVVRSGTTVTSYIDGASIGSATISGTANSGAAQGYIGDSTHAPNRNFQGYIDELRITKGHARYTANFTPPTAPFPNS